MDVRISRGKFDEINEKFTINPAPIASQSSLNAGDHDELEIFLEIRLIPSRIDQKLKNKEGKYMVLKREIGPTIVGHWSCRGGILQGSWERFHLERKRLQFRDDFDLNFASKRASK